mmetsp:Transcript_73697/g.229897  ORF Transcript_73697/g.229897 Transcript_73697/m.229897 type:complete len:214 (-) Transcript_73697:262-903(-)
MGSCCNREGHQLHEHSKSPPADNKSNNTASRSPCSANLAHGDDAAGVGDDVLRAVDGVEYEGVCMHLVEVVRCGRAGERAYAKPPRKAAAAHVLDPAEVDPRFNKEAVVRLVANGLPRRGIGRRGEVDAAAAVARVPRAEAMPEDEAPYGRARLVVAGDDRAAARGRFRVDLILRAGLVATLAQTLVVGQRLLVERHVRGGRLVAGRVRTGLH